MSVSPPTYRVDHDAPTVALQVFAPQTPPVERRFRPDVEGLRAVAVLLVVLYHGKLLGLTGGYVGVDVFFVISGFLITRQLFEMQERHGRVRLLTFYVRRMKRLLPASAVVLVAVLVAARIWSSTLAARDIANDAFFSAVYLINYSLAASGTNYLNAEKAPSPLQHFWSLSVEEQFYIGLPLLILTLVAIRPQWRRSTLIGLLAAAFVVSLYFCITVTQTSAAQAYFSIHTRAWELALGSLVALTAPRLARLPGAVAAAGSWLGIALVIGTAFVYDDTTPFPGSAALVPVCGAALVIACGCRATTWSAERVLGRWAFQMVGKVSYSWYLWHWPVLIFTPLVVGEDMNLSRTIQALFVSLVIAVFSYFHIELPARRLQLRKPAWIVPGLGVSAVTASLALLAAATLPSLEGTGAAVQQAVLASSTDVAGIQLSVAQGLLTTQVPSNLDPRLDRAAADVPESFQECNLNYLETEQPPCLFGDPNGTRTMVLFGDSHANQWFGAFDSVAKARHWRLFAWTKAACSAAAIALYPPVLKREYTECAQWRAATVAKIVDLRPQLIIAGQSDSVPGDGVTDLQWARATLVTMRQLAASGADTFLMGDIPRAPVNPAECLTLHLNDVQQCNFTRQAGYEHPQRRTVVHDVLNGEGFAVVDTGAWVCRIDYCPVIIGNNLVYRDFSHLTNAYATFLSPLVRPLVIAAEKP